MTSEAELGPTSAGFGRHVCGAVVREHLRPHSLGCPEELPLAVRRLRREAAAVVLGDARRRRELLLEAVHLVGEHMHVQVVNAAAAEGAPAALDILEDVPSLGDHAEVVLAEVGHGGEERELVVEAPLRGGLPLALADRPAAAAR